MSPIRRALAETEGRPDADSLDNGSFHWHTADGVYVRPGQMDTLHLFHTVRLLWNHSVPDAQQLKPFRQWNLTLDADERAEAMTEMLAELARRDQSPLTAAQQAELFTIRLKDKVWTAALKTLDTDERGGYLPGDRWDPYDALEEEDFRDGCPNC